MEYKFIVIPIITVLLTQLIFKSLILKIKNKFTWKELLSYGGMPSAHSALVSALATSIAMQRGFNSIEFAISFFFAGIVITDAIGLRGFLTKQSKAINKIIIDLPDDKEYKYEILNERIAHTFSETIVGIIVGITISYILMNLVK